MSKAFSRPSRKVAQNQFSVPVDKAGLSFDADATNWIKIVLNNTSQWTITPPLPNPRMQARIEYWFVNPKTHRSQFLCNGDSTMAELCPDIKSEAHTEILAAGSMLPPEVEALPNGTAFERHITIYCERIQSKTGGIRFIEPPLQLSYTSYFIRP